MKQASKTSEQPTHHHQASLQQSKKTPIVQMANRRQQLLSHDSAIPQQHAQYQQIEKLIIKPVVNYRRPGNQQPSLPDSASKKREPDTLKDAQSIQKLFNNFVEEKTSPKPIPTTLNSQPSRKQYPTSQTVKVKLFQGGTKKASRLLATGATTIDTRRPYSGSQIAPSKHSKNFSKDSSGPEQAK